MKIWEKCHWSYGFRKALYNHKRRRFQSNHYPWKTGILYEPPYVESLARAIEGFDESRWDPSVCRKGLSSFPKKKFVKRIKRIISNMLSRDV